MTLATAILSTLNYSNHFDYPLTLSEIHARLICVKTTLPELISTLTTLLNSHQISQNKDYYFLPSHHQLVVRRLKNKELSQPLFTRAQALATHLSSFSFILAIYLTGSLAVNNTDGNSDIDFMIITQNNHLWTTRFLLILYTTIFGLRRTPNSKNNSGKLCLNLYLTPNSYTLPSSKRSLYTAYELIQAVPLYDPNNTQAQIFSANPWIKKYLPNYRMPSRSYLVGCKSDQKPTRSNLMGTIELFLFKIQYLYMRSKITREYITKDAAFFHPHDPAPKG